MQNLGLKKYASQFEEADIDYGTFLTLNEDHPRELDLTLGVRIKIMNEVSHLKEQEECTRGKKKKLTLRTFGFKLMLYEKLKKVLPQI